MYHIEFTHNAESEIELVRDWIRQQSREIADRWLARLTAKIDTLRQRPDRCPLAPEADEFGVAVRELLFGKRQGTYRILFSVDGDVVRILHFRHSSRRNVRPKGD